MTNRLQFPRVLPNEEQVSDDFGLYTDGTYFYAVRAEREGGPEIFVKERSKWHAISKAVDIFQEYVEDLPYVRPLPYWDNEDQKVLWS